MGVANPGYGKCTAADSRNDKRTAIHLPMLSAKSGSRTSPIRVGKRKQRVKRGGVAVNRSHTEPATI